MQAPVWGDSALSGMGGKTVRRNLSFFRIEHNGQKYYVTAAEWGPYTDVDEAMAQAEWLNAQQTAEQKRKSRAVVLEWRQRKLGGKLQ